MCCYVVNFPFSVKIYVVNVIVSTGIILGLNAAKLLPGVDDSPPTSERIESVALASAKRHSG